MKKTVGTVGYASPEMLAGAAMRFAGLSSFGWLSSELLMHYN